jgi:23S rRNA pseudouridine2605 synthase
VSPDGADVTDTFEDGERLQKVLARVGLGSRRVCEDLIAAGRVAVNGERAVLGKRVDAEHDVIALDGTPIGVKAGLVYYLLNKPPGVVTTADDPQGRPTVVDLVPEEPRVFPVGRLDMDTEGLLLLTNDGELTHRLTHPSFGVDKEYVAQVEGEPTRRSVRKLREGIELDDGLTAPAQAALVGPSVIRLTIHEGRNRQVRRMCEAIGHPVTRLIRTRIGPLADRKLKPGTWRELTVDEIRALERAAGPQGVAEPKPVNSSGRGSTPRGPTDRRP